MSVKGKHCVSDEHFDGTSGGSRIFLRGSNPKWRGACQPIIFHISPKTEYKLRELAESGNVSKNGLCRSAAQNISFQAYILTNTHTSAHTHTSTHARRRTPGYPCSTPALVSECSLSACCGMRPSVSPRGIYARRAPPVV